MADRPLLVVLIGILIGVAGLILLITGLLLEFMSIETLIDWGFDPTKLGTFDTYVYIVLGAALFVVAALIWTGWTFAWYVALIFLGIQLLWQLYQFATGMTTTSPIISIIILLALLYYLFKPNVKEFFSV